MVQKSKSNGPTYVRVNSMSVFRQGNCARPSPNSNCRLVQSYAPEATQSTEAAQTLNQDSVGSNIYSRLRNLSLLVESLPNLWNNDMAEFNYPSSPSKSDLTRAISRIDTSDELEYSEMRKLMQMAIAKLGGPASKTGLTGAQIVRELQHLAGNRRRFNDMLGILDERHSECASTI